jgi:hypothetical protein
LPEDAPLILLAFLITLAIYGLILAFLNRSRHPILVAGTWDFVGVLFAASGFLFLSGPAILEELYEKWRVPWLLGESEDLPTVAQNWGVWVALWVVYFVVVIVAAAWGLWRGRRCTSIYNIDPVLFEAVLTHVLERLRLDARREGPRRLVIRPLPPREEEAGSGNGLQPSGLASYTWARLEVDPSPLLCHVTLSWGAEGRELRAEVESELAQALARVPSPDNPAGAVLLGLVIGVFFLLFLAVVGLWIYRLFFHNR